jgi:hypothetical protein
MKTKETCKLVRNIYKKEKGFDTKTMSDEEFIVNTINLLLCHLDQTDMVDTIVGLKLVTERLGIDKCCIIWVDTDTFTENRNYKVRLFYTGEEQDA